MKKIEERGDDLYHPIIKVLHETYIPTPLFPVMLSPPHGSTKASLAKEQSYKSR